MFARTSIWRGGPQEIDNWARHVADNVGPMVQGLPGNLGAFFLADAAGGHALTLTLWESEDTARVSDEAADRSRDATVAATGVELLERGRYQVVSRV
jgi:heme-degrading monooxygenase HmoA